MTLEKILEATLQQRELSGAEGRAELRWRQTVTAPQKAPGLTLGRERKCRPCFWGEKIKVPF